MNNRLRELREAKTWSQQELGDGSVFRARRSSP
jgi:hypothetical protein